MESLFYIFGSVAFLFYIAEHVYMIRVHIEARRHDKYCEDCADELMAETFKSMREKENDR